jgi:hypothetical protein
VQLVEQPWWVFLASCEIHDASPLRFPNSFLQQLSIREADCHLDRGTTVPGVVFLQPNRELCNKIRATPSVQLPSPIGHHPVCRLQVVFGRAGR